MKHAHRLLMVVLLSALLFSACAPKTVIVEKTVEVEKTVVVEKTIEVEKTVEVEKVVKETVQVEKVVTATPLPPEKFKQAPQLAAMVDAGKLPPIEERLPTNPMVVTPHEEIGQYGGTWRMGLRGGGDTALLSRTMHYEPLARWTVSWDGWIPNVAESIESNEDGSEWTIGLRKGMKWSDGAPFTADDIVFWYEDIMLNTDLTASPPSHLVVGGEPVEIEKIDDFTVVAKFATPYGFFPLQMAQAGRGLWAPAHYLKQFHIAYTPGVSKAAEDAGFADWIAYFGNRNSTTENPDRPVLFPWVLTSPYGSGAQVLVAKRNPYYWKVDTEGNQLPYIDEIVFNVGESVDLLVLQALNGEIDMQTRHIGTLANKPVLADGREAGDYRFFTTQSTWGNAACFYLNHTHQDPVMREIIHNKDFRIGLSHAIDRQEIIDAVFAGLATPWQFAPLKGTPFYNEQMATQYTEYDVDRANEYLDKVVPDKDGAGFRLRPDGERVTLVVEVAAARTDDAAISELVVQYWQAVGLDAILQVEDRSIQWEHKAANDYDVFVWPAGGGGGLEVMLNAQAYFPERRSAWWAPVWGDWYASEGAEGEEPIEVVKQMMKLYEELKTKPTFEAQVETMNEIVQLSADYFPMPCISTQPDGFGVVKNNMYNVPESMIYSWTWPCPAPTNPEQYSFR